MPGRGPAPKPVRRRRNKPVRGEWKATDAVGWQHGDLSPAPDGLKDASIIAWDAWFGAWFAAHWTPDDLPGLRIVIRLYDEVERGEFTRATELRQMLDNYGITPKGQQDRHWQRPAVEEEKSSQSQRRRAVPDQYAHLKVVNE